MDVSRQDPWLIVKVDRTWTGKLITELTRTLLLSDKTTKALIREGHLLVRNQPATWDTVLNSGDRVRLYVLPEENPTEAPEPMELTIMYEDDHVMVIDKSAGVKVHPTHPNETGTLANGVAFHQMVQGQSMKVRHVHRLDQETSGLLLYAKHGVAARFFQEEMSQRRIKREYVAVVIRRVSPKTGRIDQPIGRDRHHPVRRIVSKTGDAAVTHYRVLSQTANHSLLEVSLETGRTHQIRVHLSHIGHPLMGDAIYGGPVQKIKRQALHAFRLTFRHPFSYEEIVIESPLPEDIQRAISDLGLQFKKG